MRFEVQPPSVNAIAANEAASNTDLRMRVSPEDRVTIRLPASDAVTTRQAAYRVHSGAIQTGAE
ncbi:putative uncharacterized protein [Pseudomonas sp. StFLB209]|nr:putative uncharacterized protein [Pseudomonas sp. StFLB209]